MSLLIAPVAFRLCTILKTFHQNLSLQQASIETVSDKRLDRAGCLLCHQEIHKVDFAYHFFLPLTWSLQNYRKNMGPT